MPSLKTKHHMSYCCCEKTVSTSRGDIRVLEAKDVLALHHMIDCIVFPHKGNTPYPNEYSESDLDGDGDLYFLSWDCDLITTGMTILLNQSTRQLPHLSRSRKSENFSPTTL
ncbi:unnamed protein product [Microthlaspi erraticum]|uniref:RNA-dependent RNA polymerase n=1 Tax=Microthlaspi erraticum TaxID=1685480 RepID=A0A6D2HYM1_9BRAS|nr:unnamed protein product [Microthlaspi erraticum]